MSPNEEKTLIEKKILNPGTKSVCFKNGTKVKFHFETRKQDLERTKIDASRSMGKCEPLELVLGKKFKLEVWEAILQKMALNEVALFTVDKSLVAQYPFISKTLRDLHKTKDEVKHTCAMSLQTEGLGYEDLNELLKNPCNLEFIMELISVTQPEEYEKETWQMSEEERIKTLPDLKERGNSAFKLKDYNGASNFYGNAIGILEQLMLKEKPHDEEWNALNIQKIPFLLNYAQCKLMEQDYYAVIEHCGTVLQIEPDNVKALFRRAKGHVGAWNPDLAKADFYRVIELDEKLSNSVKKELVVLEELIRKKNVQDKEKMKNLFG